MHAPKILHGIEKFPNATLQIGDGDHIAVNTGIITIADFRQKHVAAGGEGAPLAVYGDYFIFGKKGENRIMLNMGGIANFTYLPANMNPEEVFVQIQEQEIPCSMLLPEPSTLIWLMTKMLF
jgi:anhydro-N-acetylmuramic acid kinase